MRGRKEEEEEWRGMKSRKDKKRIERRGNGKRMGGGMERNKIRGKSQRRGKKEWKGGKKQVRKRGVERNEKWKR